MTQAWLSRYSSLNHKIRQPKAFMVCQHHKIKSVGGCLEEVAKILMMVSEARAWGLFLDL